MTNANNGNYNSQEIYTILAELARRQLTTQEQIERTQQQLSATQFEVESLTSDVTRVLGRDAILNDVLLELRDSHEQHQRNFEQHLQNFEEHRRTTNAALNSLEAINLRLIQIITGN
jgi:predicted  nucleic acid-binding Zn-ribbon protein